MTCSSVYSHKIFVREWNIWDIAHVIGLGDSYHLYGKPSTPMNLINLFCRTDSCDQRFEHIRPRLYRMAYSWCHNPALADDLVQETLIKGLKNIKQLQDTHRFNSWLFSIMANCWHDHFRSHKDMENIDDIADFLYAHDNTPERIHAQAQIVHQVRCALDKLPLPQRQVVTLVDLEDFSYLEVASILSIPIGTVMSRLCRARQALQQLLKELDATTRIPTIRRVK